MDQNQNSITTQVLEIILDRQHQKQFAECWYSEANHTAVRGNG